MCKTCVYAYVCVLDRKKEYTLVALGLSIIHLNYSRASDLGRETSTDLSFLLFQLQQENMSRIM